MNDLKLTEKGTAENILDADSGITYKYIKDICNECFGKNYKAYQRGHYNICLLYTSTVCSRYGAAQGSC